MTTYITINNISIPVHRHDTIIVGSGASGFSAAEQLAKMHHTDVALITEHINAGTSRNTGSDKQTYYKLTLSGDQPDSIADMTATLMSGGCVDGDLALCEAALSTRCFMHLVDLGVPFPCNAFGEYIGYKTDHDPKKRATSAGPYTSKMMTEVLEDAVKHTDTVIYDHTQVIKILTDECSVYGLLCLNVSSDSAPEQPFVIFQCNNIIYATGGPAGIYLDSVYPYGHFGSTGLALEAGIIGKNLTEWQYGLASKRPRWNVSGTYMQCLPRFISTNPDGSDEQEFLNSFFEDFNDMIRMVFLKGYQWPFDVRKIDHGSSIIDILVYLETQKGRRVYLDFRKNPGNGIVFEQLSAEVKDYLSDCDACFGTPFERLLKMNEPAVAFYLDHGIDLRKEPLEIALCAQHNNGGLGIDHWWQTNKKGFFCIGEASCSHGVYRPGGTALNAGQVGALRAAQYISVNPHKNLCDLQIFLEQFESQIAEMIALAAHVLGNEPTNIKKLIRNAQEQMSHFGAAFRNCSDMKLMLENTVNTLSDFSEICHIQDLKDLTRVYRLRDILICQQVYLAAMIDYAKTSNLSRGSALYTDFNGEKPFSSLPDQFTYRLEASDSKSHIQEITYAKDGIKINWRSPRPVPALDQTFENVWKSYRENRNII